MPSIRTLLEKKINKVANNKLLVHLELIIWKKVMIIHHKDNIRPNVQIPSKNCNTLAGKFSFIQCIWQILHLWIIIYSGIYRILLIEFFRKLQKTIRAVFLQRKKGWKVSE